MIECFSLDRSKNNLPQNTGWYFFDLVAEYARQGLPNSSWVTCTLNQDWKICPTYPQNLIVPALASSSTVMGCSKFRSKGRLPILTYYHDKTGAALVRCAQPLSGLKGRSTHFTTNSLSYTVITGRSSEDEQYISSIVASNPCSNFLYIVDTRPKINAMANRAGGKGYESEAFYTNTKFVFKGIENIHVMRESLGKLIDACQLKSDTVDNFLHGLDQSNWLKHLKAVLDASLFMSESLVSGVSVVVHCSGRYFGTIF